MKIFGEEEIKEALQRITLSLNVKHYHDSTPIVFIGVLNGCFMFFADLVRRIDYPAVECDFVSIKSYEGKEKKDLLVVKNIEVSLEGKHVYIVDDIYDSGETINYLFKKYKSLNPKSLTAIALIKRENSEVAEGVDLISGIDIPKDMWIYGYGMDNLEGYGRNLPYILV